MPISQTQYQVVKQGRIVCTGNLRQCMMWLFNTEDLSRTAMEVTLEDTYIEPVKGGGK